jgi:uncharacterized membrane protein
MFPKREDNVAAMSPSVHLIASSGLGSSFEERVSDVVQVIEVTGTVVMVAGALAALAIGLVQAIRPESREKAYDNTRRNLGRAILLGLELLIIADIVRTIVVEPTMESVLVLGLIVLIRIILSFSLEVEMYGVWPWSAWRLRKDMPPRE